MDTSAKASEPVLLHAAGSLRSALTEVASAFEAASGQKVEARYGPSGTLKDEIAGGTRAEVFASANMEHPQALAAAGKSGPVVLFAGFARWFGRDLPSSRRRCSIACSTPMSDSAPRHRVRRAGEEGIAADRRAQRADGPAGTHDLWSAGRRGQSRDLLTYCTGALEAQKQNTGQQIVALPEELAVGADYGLTVVTRASPQAYQFAMFILSLNGQRTLARYGFAAPLLPP